MINPVRGINFKSFQTLNKNVNIDNKKQEYNVNQINNIEEVPSIKLTTEGKVTRISFKGQLQDPTMPAIQFKVRGVSHHQKDYGQKEVYTRDRNVEDLANSNWYDGKELRPVIQYLPNHTSRITLVDPNFGEIGRVPDEIAGLLIPHVGMHGKDIKVQLSNVIAGTTKGAPTIGLRAAMIYTGKDPNVKKGIQKTFDALLNSPDKATKDVVMIYQPTSTPDQVLEKIFENVDDKEGVRTAIDSICKEINSPENKNILILGHCVPDGDTIGCVLGMQAAIKANYPDKNVRISIDDQLPGSFRDKLPGSENLKRPYNAKSIEQLEADIKAIKSKPLTFQTRRQLRTYEKELAQLKNSDNYFADDIDNYDLVMLMEIPSPTRFSNAFKNEIEGAKKVIYIDHHRDRDEEWKASAHLTGIDMDKIKKDNLSLVIPSVPAATELVTVIANEAGLLERTLKNPKWAKQFVAAILSGTGSDTSYFTRSANYTPEDVQLPVRQRPNFLPEGLAKWLIQKVDGLIDKKWLRENIVYDMADTNTVEISPRQKMIDYALKSQKIFPSSGLGIINISYEEMYDIWDSQRMFDRNATLVDVQNALKYSEVMGGLREAPRKNKIQSDIEPYESIYQDDKIAVLLIQDKMAGRVDEKMKIAEKNGIRMSFRSQDGTIYSEMLASLFGGGGHGSAAGARIDIDGVTLQSPLAIKVDGKAVYDAVELYSALKENYEAMSNKELSDDKKASMVHKFETVIDENGKPVQELLNGVVSQMRLDLK